MKKIFISILFLFPITFSVFASSGNIFFGFNSWTHQENSLDSTPQEVTRILYDGAKYYVMPEENNFHLSINSYRINTLNQINVTQEKDTLKIYTVEDINFNSSFTFTKEGNEFYLTLEGDLGGVIDSFQTECSASQIKISYKIRRPVRDEFGKATERYYLNYCTDTFFNTDRSVLNEAIVKAFDFALDNPDSGFAELTEELISQISKPELGIIRNLIYARHGYIFKNKNLQDLFFKSLKNYQPTIKNSSKIVFSDREKELLKLIQKYEGKD